ncbi:MAG: hypothetical protein ACPG5P_07975 [Saprospiraceae bacterium]
MFGDDILDADEKEPNQFSLVPKHIGFSRLVYAILYFIIPLVVALIELNAAIIILVILFYSLLESEKGYREIKGNFIPKRYAAHVLPIITNFVLLFVAVYFISVQFDLLPFDQLWKLILPVLLLFPLPFFIYYDIKHIQFMRERRVIKI